MASGMISRSIRSAAGRAFEMSKGAATLSSWEKESHRFSVTISGEKKLVNDKEVVTYKVDTDYGMVMPMGAERPLPSEYTSLESVLQAANDCIKAKAEAL